MHCIHITYIGVLFHENAPQKESKYYSTSEHLSWQQGESTFFHSGRRQIFPASHGQPQPYCRGCLASVMLVSKATSAAAADTTLLYYYIHSKREEQK